MAALAQSVTDKGLSGAPDADLLAFLRVTAARSRCLARSGVFEACAILSVDPAWEAEALAMALFQGLSAQSVGPRLRLYQPSADEISFDEHWLMAALFAAERGDDDSLTFLLTRRVRRHARRPIAVLIRALADALAKCARDRVV